MTELIIKCSHCCIDKSSKEFNKHKRRPNGYQGWCRECCTRHLAKRENFISKAYDTMKGGYVKKIKHKLDKEKLKYYELSLTKKEFLTLINDYIEKNGFVCQATGVELTTFVKGMGNETCKTNFSVDRLDPKKGYNKNNIIFVSWLFNSRKKDVELRDCFTIIKLYKERYPEKYENVKQEFKELFI
jgi:hypothetical protein